MATLRIVVSDSVVSTLELDRDELNLLRRIKVRLRHHGAVVEASPEALLALASELEVFDDFDTPAGLRAARTAAARIRREVARFSTP